LPDSQAKKEGRLPSDGRFLLLAESYFLPLTADLSFAPAANFAVLAAGILSAAPV